MYDTFNNPDVKSIIEQTDPSLQYTAVSFRAFADAIIPQTPNLAEEYGRVQYYGAIDLNTDEYMIWSLNHYYFSITEATAEMIAIAWEQLFSSLTVNVADLPIPFKNNQGFTLYIISALNRLVMMGYYSEWSGYGSTRLDTPNKRRLEYYPISWEQVGYPGPSLGYRALRVNNSL